MKDEECFQSQFRKFSLLGHHHETISKQTGCKFCSFGPEHEVTSHNNCNLKRLLFNTHHAHMMEKTREDGEWC